MLDTFAKRLASQGRPSPGDISVDDRWTLGGVFKPTLWFAGAIVAAAGASVATLSGTFTPGTPPDISGSLAAVSSPSTASLVGHADSPPATFDADDRWHLEWRPYPANGSLSLEDRYAIGGAPVRITGIAPIGGKVAATSGAALASLRGSTYISLFFDVGYAIAPALTISDIPAAAGLLTAQADAALAHFLGSTLPPNSENGLIVANSAPSAAAFLGTFVIAPGRDGRIHADSSSSVASMLGAVVPPQGNIGKIAATSSASQAALLGTFQKWQTDGRIATLTASSTARFFGQSLLPGTINGFIDGRPGPSIASLRGTVSNPLGRGFVHEHRVPRRSASYKVPAPKREAKD